METVAEIVFWTCVALLAYTYVGYGCVMAALARLRPRPVASDDVLPTLTVIVAAYNEEDVIAAKLDNLLSLDYPGDRLQVVVGSDASTDGTDAIVADHADRRVRLERVEGRLGKTAVQNRCVAVADGDVVVFTDATTMLRRDALRRIVRPFADDEVGCVGARLVYVSRDGGSVGRGGTSYWSYEARIKSWESRVGSLIGVSGCFYAVRRSFYRPIDPDLISDFVVALETVARGRRVVYEPDAVCEEETLRDAGDELRMRVRVALRTYTALWRRRELLDPLRHGLFAVQLLSHKVLRYSAGLFLVLALLANLALLDRPLYTAAFVAQIAFYVAAAAGHFVQRGASGARVLALPYYFVLANAAALIALGRALRGDAITVWEPKR